MLQNYLKIALRNLLRQRNITTLHVTGLGLGMAAAIFAFLWVQNEFSFDRYHRLANDTYRINADLRVDEQRTFHWATTPLPLAGELKNGVPEVVRSATLFANPWKPFAVRKNGVLLNSKDFAYVTEDWFRLFDHRFADGNAEGFYDHLHRAIVTRDFAQKVFGRQDVTGETLTLDSVEFTVHAVLENHPPNSSFQFEMALPMSFYLSLPQHRENDNWGAFNFLTFAELRPDTEVKVLGEKLTTLARRHEGNENLTLSVQPLAEVHFDQERSYDNLLTGNRQTAHTFAVIGLLILFLACVNYVSLTTAQAGMRTKEVGVRKIIGAQGSQVFRLFFTESLVTSVAALLLALCIVQAAMPFFNVFTEKNFRLDPADPAVWLVTGITLAAALLLSGVYPSLFLTGFSPGNFMREQNFLKMKNSGFRKALVVSQFALTVGLLIGATVIFRQQDFIRKKDLGYERSHVFEFQTPCCKGREEAVAAIKHALSAEPGVLGTASSNSSLIDVQNHTGGVDYDGKPVNFNPTVCQMSVDPDFGKMLQLPLTAGRWFEPGNQADLNHVLLNETAVRLFGMQEPVVGQRFGMHGRNGQVVGVLRDFHFQSLRNKIEPMVMYSYPLSNGNVLVKTAPGKASEALAAAGKAWSWQYPGLPFEYRFMDETFDQLYRAEAKSAGLFRVLAGLVLFISCLGLFGLAVFSTEQRRKEIGVRKVLGASVTSVVGLLSKDFLKLVVIALVIASPLAYFFMERWLQDFAYRIDIHWSVFTLAGFVAVAVAFLTVSFQSVKAALANPVKSLRSE